MTGLDGAADRVLLVDGTVTDDRGIPLPGRLVRALDRDLRSAEVLGESRSGSDGRFEIPYTASSFAHAEQGRADLQVVVLDSTGGGEPLARSEVRFNAGDRETFDLVLPAGPRGRPEIERYLSILEPLTAGVSLTELREDAEFQDLSFLAAESGIARDHLDLLVAASSAAQQLDTVPREAFYGWYRSGLPTATDQLLALPVRDLLAALKRAIADGIVPEGLADRFDELARWLGERRTGQLLTPAPEGPATLGDVLELAVDRDALTPERRRDLAALIAQNPADGRSIAAGVRRLDLAEPQLRGLRRGLALRAVTAGDPALMRAVAELTPTLSDGADGSPYASIATLSDQEWRRAVAAADPAAGGDQVAARAAAARDRVAELFPQDVLLAPAVRRPAVDELVTLVERGADPADRPPALQALVGGFPGLQLDQLLAAGGEPGRAAAEIDRRLGVLASVYARHAAVPLLELDYLPDGDADTRLDLTGLDDADRGRVLGTLKALRRVHEVSGHAGAAQRVLAAGYGSAAALAAADPVALAARAGVDLTAADRIVRTAATRAGEAALHLFAAVDATQSIEIGSTATRGPVGQSRPPATPIGTYFTRIPGYDELFGSQGYCNCRPCRSVLSPAAYFVDLMWFVQRRLTDRAFAGRSDSYPLRLAGRRPDLWVLPLTCENTDQLVPYLDIVNEVLETHVAGALRGTGAAASREAGYRRLARTTGSVSQPFHLHLERAAAYLGHVQRSRVEVAQAIGADTTTVARASLAVSVTEWDLLSRPRDTDTAFLVGLFGPATNGLTPAAKLDIADLLGATGWSRPLLGDLLESAFVRGTDRPVIEPAKRSAASVQNDVELVSGLSFGLLDRLHRMWRLHRASTVSIGELDGLIAVVPAPAGATEADRLIAVDQLLRIARRLQLPLDATGALIGPIPVTALTPVDTALFDRLFNLEPFAAQQGRWPAGLPLPFVHPSFAVSGASTPDNRTLQRITAGLGVSDAELVSLLTMLGLASAQAPTVVLTDEVLAVLFRHARLARSLSIPVTDLGRLLRLSGIGRRSVGPPAQPQWTNQVRSLQHVEALLVVMDDWRSLGFTLDDAEFVIEGRASSPAHRVAAAVATRMAGQLSRERPWEFADTVLTGLPGVSERISQQLLAENTAQLATDDVAVRPLERVPDSSMLRLRAAVDPAAAGWRLTLPVDFTLPAGLAAGQLAAAVGRFDPLTPVLTTLAVALGRPPAEVNALLRLAGPAGNESQPLEQHRDALVSAAYADTPASLASALFTARPALLRLAVLLSGEAWDAAAVQQLVEDRGRVPTRGIVFEPAGVDLSWGALVQARRYTALATEPLSPDAAEPVQPDRAALIRALAAADWSTGAVDADLAAALGTDRARIAALRPSLPLAAIARPIGRVDRLRTALRLALALGVSGETLRAIVPTPVGVNLDALADSEFDLLGQGADALYGVLHSVYPDPQVFADQLEPFEDLIRARRRDALVDFLLHPGDLSVAVTFASLSEIYGYFLLDVQLGGCARTSRIVAATQSVQLYVHRVLMALESPMWDGTITGTRETALGLVRAEWTWRQHYRVWEANRRIFLFPENYLEPELRDDRTPLFDEVAQELLQQQTDENSVTVAYTRYLQGFDELGTLRVAGAFHDTGGGGDRLHLLAATSADPPEYYQRTVAGLWTQFATTAAARPAFSPWRKVAVQIPVRDVSPAVIDGRLHAFWLESSARPVNSLAGGTDNFRGYDHRIAVKYSAARPDGGWAPPQPISVIDATGHPLLVVRDRLLIYLPKLGNETLGSAGSGTRRATPELLELEGIHDDHPEPVESYTLPGPELPFVHLDVLTGNVGNGALRALVASRGVTLDLFARRADEAVFDPFTVEFDTLDDVVCVAGGILYANALTHDGFSQSFSSLHGRAARFAQTARDSSKSWQVMLGSVPVGARGIIVRRTVPQPAVGRFGVDLIVELDRQPVLVLAAGGAHQLVRLGTGLAGSLSRRLFETGVKGLLATKFQLESAEPALPVTPVAGRLGLPPVVPTRGRLDVDGPMATYLREIWLELPYLIAGHLNGRQRFAAAQRWYHHVFDPTSEGAATDTDRVWRYRGFRGVTVQSMRDALTSGPALDAYRSEPFRPHAIARLRPGAHQRAVVMRYIDNLLDWGDALFAEFTRESLNEATMLYVLAADILGPRPAQVGDCDAGPTRTYAGLAKGLNETSDFLIELELFAEPTGKRTLRTGDRYQALDEILLTGDAAVARVTTTQPMVAGSFIAGPVVAETLVAGSVVGEPVAAPDPVSLWRSAGGTPFETGGSSTALAGTATASISTRGIPMTPPRDATRGASSGSGTAIGAGRKPLGDDTLIPFDERQPPAWWQLKNPTLEIGDDRHRPPVLDLVDQMASLAPAFCLPPNRELMAYWDRVEDRLTKIRNCMDLTGARREPALFAPEIDPLLLARALAAGLSLEDVLAPGSGSVPPYRFSFLIERARQHAQTVQAFGNALLAALERQDAEELNRLRATHERNLLQLRTRLAEWEVTAAEDAVAALEAQRDAVEYRRAYYAELRTASLTATERVQQISRHTASAAHVAASVMALVSAITTVIPQGGSPFAMTYGGVQIGGGLGRVAGAISSVAAGAEAISASAGFEANFERRADEWAHQQQLADRELKGLARQLAGAKIRFDIAKRSIDVHQRSMDQSDQVLDLLASKFTSLGRYTALSTRLHRLHREAFSTALEVARMAERAFAFERGDDAAVGLAGGYWSADSAGLGAGDALVVDLQRLEQRYLETNLRTLEVEQSFSLALLNPRALITLQEKGSCSFTIPETAFDLTYPGQYRRRIRAVRVSVPCVTGPHVSVGATLRLTRSYLRRDARLADPLLEVPLRHTTAVATSSAQSDPGVFEFSFRDERYLPFEGAGAISDWELDLPATFRSFDYRTISDVVLRIGYTAEEDRTLRTDVEKAVTTVAGSLRHELETGGLPLLLSCRYDAPEAWRMLQDAAPGTAVTIPITQRQLTGALADWLHGRDLPVGSRPRLALGDGSVVLVTQGGAARTRPTVTLSGSLGAAPVALAVGATAGPAGLYQAPLTGTAALDHNAAEAVLTLRVDTPGNLAPAAAGTIDQAKLRDLLVLLTVKLAVFASP